MPSQFSQGLATGSSIVQNRQALALQQREQQQKAQEIEQKALVKQGEQANKAITGILDTAGKLSEAFRSGQTNMTPEQFSEQINNFVGVAMRTAQLGSQSGLPVMSPELIEAQRQQLLSTATPEQAATSQGRAKGIEEVSSAAVKTQAIGGNREQRLANFANFIGISEGTQPEFFQLLDEMEKLDPKSPRARFVRDRIERLSQLEGQQAIKFSMDKEGNVSVNIGSGSIPDRFTLTGQQLDQLRAHKSATDTALGMVDSMMEQLEADPTRFGVVGSARKGAEAATGIVSDLAQTSFSVLGVDAKTLFENLNQTIEIESADKEAKELLRPVSPGDVDVFQAFLKFTVARALQPEGRLMKDTIQTADGITKLTGLTSSSLVQQRMRTIRNILENRQSELQRRMEQGLTGTASTPTKEIRPSGTQKQTKESQDELDVMVERILEGE